MHPDASAAQILHELRPILGPTNLKKLKVSTLPYVRKEDGELCSLPNEAIAVWSDFFRHMEGGIRMSRMNNERYGARILHLSASQSSISMGPTCPALQRSKPPSGASIPLKRWDLTRSTPASARMHRISLRARRMGN